MSRLERSDETVQAEARVLAVSRPDGMVDLGKGEASHPGTSEREGRGSGARALLQMQRQTGNRAVSLLLDPDRAEVHPRPSGARAVVQRDAYDQEDNYADEDDSTQSDWGSRYGFEPYEREVNWDQQAPALAPSAAPAPWLGALQPALPAALRPARWLTARTGTYTERVNMAVAARSAFTRDWDAVHASWHALEAARTAYANAGDDIASTGVLGTHGLDWQPGRTDEPADVESLTSAQQVGPDGAQVKISSLFSPRNGVPGSALDAGLRAPRGTVQTRRDIVALNVARDALVASLGSHSAHQQLYLSEKQRMTNALRQVKLVEQQVDQDRLETEKRELVRRQEETIAGIEAGWSAAEAVTLVGFGVGEGIVHGPAAGAESVLIGLEIAGEAIHRAIATAESDKQIEALNARIDQTTASIRAEQTRYAQGELQAAVQAVQAHKILIDTSKVEVRLRLVELQGKYSPWREASVKLLAAAGEEPDFKRLWRLSPRWRCA